MPEDDNYVNNNNNTTFTGTQAESSNFLTTVVFTDNDGDKE